MSPGGRQRGRSFTFAENQCVEARDSVMALVRDDLLSEWSLYGEPLISEGSC